MTTLSHGRGWLDSEAAASIHRIDAELGHALQITDAGRTRAQQEEEYAKDPDNAAPPGESPHESGKAVDSNEARHHEEMMRRHGWRRPLPREWWHWVYWRDLDQHRNDHTPTNTPTLLEEEMKHYRLADDGNGAPCWVLLSPRTGKFLPTYDQDHANSWAEAWGNAQPISRRAFLDAIDAAEKLG